MILALALQACYVPSRVPGRGPTVDFTGRARTCDRRRFYAFITGRSFRTASQLLVDAGAQSAAPSAEYVSLYYIPDFRSIDSFQRRALVSQVPCRMVFKSKAAFAAGLAPYLERRPEHSHIHPLSFVLPQQRPLLEEYRKAHPGCIFLVKKSTGMQGRDVGFLDDAAEPLYSEDSSAVAQLYLEPLLHDGHKVDIRMYLVITSIDPLIVYLHE